MLVISNIEMKLWLVVFVPFELFSGRSKDLIAKVKFYITFMLLNNEVLVGKL